MKNPIVDLLVKTNAIRFGAFTLKSGEPSPIFIDLGRVSDGRSLAEIGEAFAEATLRFFPTITHLFGPAYKGISLATSTAIALTARNKNIETLFDRKEPKAHGEGGVFIGAEPTPSAQIVVIDDVTTSGKTKIDAFARLEAAFGAKPIGVLVAVDRSRGKAARELAAFNVRALISLSDIAAHLEATQAPQAASIRNYVEMPA